MEELPRREIKIEKVEKPKTLAERLKEVEDAKALADEKFKKYMDALNGPVTHTKPTLLEADKADRPFFEAYAEYTKAQSKLLRLLTDVSNDKIKGLK